MDVCLMSDGCPVGWMSLTVVSSPNSVCRCDHIGCIHRILCMDALFAHSLNSLGLSVGGGLGHDGAKGRCVHCVLFSSY